MKRILTYICTLLWLAVSCQMPAVPEAPAVECDPDRVTVSFNVLLPDGGEATKSFGDDPYDDIKSLHLIVFDENGYYIETCRAEMADSETTHGTHRNERTFTVTLRKTEKERIIHFIANCPVDQIHYGNENDIISNLYVTKGAEMETAYWYRMQVWYIQTKDDGKTLVDEIADKFKCVPLLRNYASVTVLDNASDFEMESYAIYNTIDLGTVAPYSIAEHGFQSFVDEEKGLLTYDQLITSKFEGHALARASLKTTLNESEFLAPGTLTYMYERKISVRPGAEHQWSESPPHIIIKGKYDGAAAYSYYKVDLIRNVGGRNVYYNILRNFRYTFTIGNVAGPGYPTLAEAMNNPAGNNLSGATDTQGFTNISDGLGRIFVNYTDTTLISSADVKLRYKYVPSIYDYNTVANDRVKVEGILDGTGTVIKSVNGIDYDAGDGWAEVTFDVQEVGNITHLQEIQLNVTDNSNLHKTIRYRMQKPLEMFVNCYPNKVARQAGRPMNVVIRIPDYLTDDMFPLDLAIEVKDLTLSPDATAEDNELPVEPSLSLIPDKAGKHSFHFVKSIETYDDYKSLPYYDGMKVVSTYWLTTKAESASTAYVYNKYFNLAWDDFTNAHGFSLLSFPDGVRATVGSLTRFEFNTTGTEPITVTLSGLRDVHGNTEFTYTPSSVGMQYLDLYTLNASGTVSVTLGGDAYEPASLSAEQTNVLNVTIPQLIITFRYTHSYSPTTNTVTPVLSVDGGSVSYGGISRRRSGSSRNYTYTITLTDVQITCPDQNSTLDIEYVYRNSQNATYTYTASPTVGSLMSNSAVTLTE